MSCGNFFLSQLIQDLCSAGAFVADYLMSGLFFQLPDQFRRKSVLRKCLKGLLYLKPHHLPVSGHGVFPFASLPELSVISQAVFHRFHLLQRCKICHAHLLKIRDDKTVHRPGDMPQSIHIHISELRGILHCSHAKRVHNNYKYSLIFFHIQTVLSGKPFHPAEQKSAGFPYYLYDTFCIEIMKNR